MRTLLALLLFASTGHAQDKAQATKIETFLASKGKAFVRGYTVTGKIHTSSKMIIISAIEYWNLNSTNKVKGISVEFEGAASPATLVDLDEVDELIRGINFLDKTEKSITALENFEATYRTKGGLEITAFNIPNGTIRCMVSTGRIGGAAIIEKWQLAALITAFGSAKDILEAVK